MNGKLDSFILGNLRQQLLLTAYLMDWFSKSRPPAAEDEEDEDDRMDSVDQRDRSADIDEQLHDALDEIRTSASDSQEQAGTARGKGRPKKMDKKKTEDTGSPALRRSDRKRRSSSLADRTAQGQGSSKRHTRTSQQIAFLGNSDSEDSLLNADPTQARIIAMLTGLEKKLDKSEERTTAKIALKIDGLEERLQERIEKSEAEIQKLKEAVNRGGAQYTKLRANVDRRMDDIDKRLHDVPDIINRAVSDRLASEECRPPALRTIGRRPRPDNSEAGPSSSATDRYWEARKCLRLYPVQPGDNLEASVLLYLTGKLKVPADTACELAFTAKQLPNRPGKPERPNKVKDEVLVAFETPEQRDEVLGHARNLQGQEDHGINMEVPYHLRSNAAALRDLAYKMKQKRQNFRRNVRLDDRTLDVVMDWTTDGTTWSSVTAEQARTNLAKRRKTSTTTSQRDLDEIIGTSDLESEEESV